MKVTPAERRAIEAVQREGSVKGAAFALGKSYWTVVRQLDSARKRLGANSTIQATGMIREEPT